REEVQVLDPCFAEVLELVEPIPQLEEHVVGGELPRQPDQLGPARVQAPGGQQQGLRGKVETLFSAEGRQGVEAAAGLVAIVVVQQIEVRFRPTGVRRRGIARRQIDQRVQDKDSRQ